MVKATKGVNPADIMWDFIKDVWHVGDDGVPGDTGYMRVYAQGITIDTVTIGDIDPALIHGTVTRSPLFVDAHGNLMVVLSGPGGVPMPFPVYGTAPYDYLQTMEMAPVVGQYFTSPAALSNGDTALALLDASRQLKVNIAEFSSTTPVDINIAASDISLTLDTSTPLDVNIASLTDPLVIDSSTPINVLVDPTLPIAVYIDTGTTSMVTTPRETPVGGVIRKIIAYSDTPSGETVVDSLEWTENGRLGEIRLSVSVNSLIQVYINDSAVVGGTQIESIDVPAGIPYSCVLTVPESVANGYYVVVTVSGVAVPIDINGVIRGWLDQVSS